MENNRAPRARFIAAIILFLAVVIGDLVLCRDYLAQGLPDRKSVGRERVC